MNFLLTLAYDGTNYCGFQVQPNGRSVAAVFQDALEAVLGARPDIKGCSRTDAGVHALGFMLNFHADTRIPPEKLSAGGYKRYTDCYIDIGLHSKEEVLKYVDVGDVACYEGPYTELAPGYITAKAIDDRVGCYMLLAAMMNVKKPKNDIYLAFTVQEEVGTRGGQVTAQRIQPDIGVAVDVTPCHDRPGDLEGSNALDHGVAIKISDTGSISDEGLVNKSIALCKEHNVPYQKDVIYVGGTDAGAMTLVGGGIKTIGFSVVTRYTHGPNAIVSQKDIEATVKMLELFMNADFE